MVGDGLGGIERLAAAGPDHQIAAMGTGEIDEPLDLPDRALAAEPLHLQGHLLA